MNKVVWADEGVKEGNQTGSVPARKRLFAGDTLVSLGETCS